MVEKLIIKSYRDAQQSQNQSKTVQEGDGSKQPVRHLRQYCVRDPKPAQQDVELG